MKERADVFTEPHLCRGNCQGLNEWGQFIHLTLSLHWGCLLCMMPPEECRHYVNWQCLLTWLAHVQRLFKYTQDKISPPPQNTDAQKGACAHWAGSSPPITADSPCSVCELVHVSDTHTYSIQAQNTAAQHYWHIKQFPLQEHYRSLKISFTIKPLVNCLICSSTRNCLFRWAPALVYSAPLVYPSTGNVILAAFERHCTAVTWFAATFWESCL